MDYLPICIDLRGKRVAVVGGGTVAARKASTALRAGAQVTVYAGALESEFDALRDSPSLAHVARPPAGEDLAACTLVFCATSDAAFNRSITAQARAVRVPVNVADAPESCDFIMPAIVDRAPLVIAVSTGGAAPLFARLVRARIEETIPMGYGRVLDFVGGYRQRVIEALPAGAARRRFWEGVAGSVVIERVLRGDIAGARGEIERLLVAAADGAAAPGGGEVWLVAAGHGDPELLTLRALRLLQRADVVVHDADVRDSILDLVRRDAERVRAGGEIGALLVSLAREGQRVLRLTVGDTHVWEAGAERAALDAAGITCEIVPGVAGPGVSASPGARRGA